MIFVSQLTSFPDGTVTREVDGIEYDFAYTGKSNIPVNMDWFITVKRAKDPRSCYAIDTPEFQVFVDYPTIVFQLVLDYGRTGNTSVTWHYPPTERGRKMRDMDYEFIMRHASKKCPSIDEIEADRQLLQELANDPQLR